MKDFNEIIVFIFENSKKRAVEKAKHCIILDMALEQLCRAWKMLRVLMCFDTAENEVSEVDNLTIILWNVIDFDEHVMNEVSAFKKR